VVDGNVFRCISRYFDIETDIALASAKRIAALAQLMPKMILQHSIRLGLVLCNVFLKVQTTVCVFNSSCAALQKKVDQLPVKSKR
jgi:A/G-specific adenine glycosylase